MVVGRQWCDRKAADNDLLIVSWVCRVGRGAVGQLADGQRRGDRGALLGAAEDRRISGGRLDAWVLRVS